jgi:hypothetical protein
MTARASVTAPLAAIAIACSVLPARAQNEAALRQYFEGKTVVLRMNMPGTADGVDVRDGHVDLRQVDNRLRQYGTSLAEGERATVTLVKVKKDVIEFQLNGGGYGTFSDDTSTSVNMPDVPKSNHEKDLEQRVKAETNPDRKKALQRDLDDVRNARERENRRIAIDRANAEAAKKRLITQRRLEGGSRFNLRYASAVPANISPRDIVDVLGEFVDFNPSPESGSTNDRGLRKGLLRAEAERLLGRPVDSSERREGALRVLSLVFVRGNDRITAEFVEDVLIRYTIFVR